MPAQGCNREINQSYMLKGYNILRKNNTFKLILRAHIGPARSESPVATAKQFVGSILG